MVKFFIKKLLCLMLLFFVLSPSVIKAANTTADYETGVNKIQPRGMICPRCNQYDFDLKRKSETPWGKQKTQLCTHYAWGTDVWCVRSVTEIYECRNCSYTETYSYEEGDWFCEGYDRDPAN